MKTDSVLPQLASAGRDFCVVDFLFWECQVILVHTVGPK